MKYKLLDAYREEGRRSREGAWIEIFHGALNTHVQRVAPARERGLKLRMLPILKTLHCVAPARERGLKLQEGRKNQGIPGRSREGAWIEILYHENLRAYVYRRSREGAWIEITHYTGRKAAAGCRSREGAWIEIAILTHSKCSIRSLPRGSVD